MVTSGFTVSSICLRIYEEIVRGIATPDPNPTTKAKASRDSQAIFGTKRVQISNPIMTGMSGS